ncbi:MAG TPA: hypothetical protein VLK33_00050 [Terriglobales bacterium]|nr:hypothetical protein [Terriglobales bacterium]
MDVTKIAAYAIDAALILAGLYLAYLGWKTVRLPALSVRQAAKSAVFFTAFAVLGSLGFMLIIMTSDGTLTGEYLFALLLIWAMVGVVLFIFFFVGALLIYRLISSTRKILETKKPS